VIESATKTTSAAEDSNSFLCFEHRVGKMKISKTHFHPFMDLNRKNNSQVESGGEQGGERKGFFSILLMKIHIPFAITPASMCVRRDEN